MAALEPDSNDTQNQDDLGQVRDPGGQGSGTQNQDEPDFDEDRENM